MTQVRIAFIYPGDVGGGDLKHVSGAGRLLDLARVAVLAGAAVTVIAIGGGTPEPQQVSAGLTIQHVPEELAIGTKLGWITGETPAMRAVAEILEAQHIDTVCLYGTSLRYSTACAARQAARVDHCR